MIVYVSLNTTDITSVNTSICVFRIQTFTKEMLCNFLLIKPIILEKITIYVTEQIVIQRSHIYNVWNMLCVEY